MCESISISSVQSLDRLGHGGGGEGVMTDDSADILFRSFLQEALVSSSGMGRAVHSLMLSCSISLASHDVAHSPRCREGGFWRGCQGA